MNRIECSKMKALLAAVLIILGGGAAPAAQVVEGGLLGPYTFVDNHGQSRELQNNTEVVLMSFEMEKSKEIHSYLEKKSPDFLEKNKTEYIADISKMPAIITKLFAGPKMARYKFPILLVKENTFADRYPKKPGKITVLVLNEKKAIAHILFLNNMTEVESLIVK